MAKKISKAKASSCAKVVAEYSKQEGIAAAKKGKKVAIKTGKKIAKHSKKAFDWFKSKVKK